MRRAAARQQVAHRSMKTLLQSVRSASVGFASTSLVAKPAGSTPAGERHLADTFSKELVDSIYRSSFKNQTGVSLKYMMDFGAHPIQRQLMMSSQFLHKVGLTRFL